MRKMRNYTPSEMAVLRKSAAHWNISGTIGSKLRESFNRLHVLRDCEGRVAGFGKEGFTLTPHGANLWNWHEVRQRQQQVNWR